MDQRVGSANIEPKASPGRIPLSYVLPIAAGIFALAAWQAIVVYFEVPKFLVPSPLLIAQTMAQDASSLLNALVFTAVVTLSAFILAVATGIIVGVILAQNCTLEMTLWPYAVAMQVTPVVAIAPLVIIWVGLDRVWLSMLILAWMVAFFPMLSNTAIGMKSADHGLRNVFELYESLALEAFPLPAASLRFALHPRRRAHLVRTLGDRRGGCRIRRRLRWLARPRLHDRRKRNAAEHPAHVRGPGHAVDLRNVDLVRHRNRATAAAAALA